MQLGIEPRSLALCLLPAGTYTANVMPLDHCAFFVVTAHRDIDLSCIWLHRLVICQTSSLRCCGSSSINLLLPPHYTTGSFIYKPVCDSELLQYPKATSLEEYRPNIGISEPSSRMLERTSTTPELLHLVQSPITHYPPTRRPGRWLISYIQSPCTFVSGKLVISALLYYQLHSDFVKFST